MSGREYYRIVRLGKQMGPKLVLKQGWGLDQWEGCLYWAQEDANVMNKSLELGE